MESNKLTDFLSVELILNVDQLLVLDKVKSSVN